MRPSLIEPLESRIAPATLTISDASLVEGASGISAMTFTVTLSEAITNPVSVDFATANGTATVAGNDFIANAGILTFSPGGELTQEITVEVIGDTAVEPNETFTVQLTNPSGATLSDATGTGTIRTDDFGIRVNDVSVSEGNAGTTTAIFVVTLEQPVPSGQQLVVSYFTQDGSAVSTSAGRDFDSIAGPTGAPTLTFAAGESVKTVAVTVRGDVVREANEQFFLKLADARLTGEGQPAEGQPVAIADESGTGTILDDGDTGRPTVRIGDVTVAEGNSGTTNATFTVSLSQSTTTDTVINYSTLAGTATEGSDFTAATNANVTIPAGQTSVTIDVPIVGDQVDEPDETFSVKLNNAISQEAGTPALAITDDTGLGTITDDDEPLPTIRIGDVTVIEGNSGTTGAVFTVTLSAPSVFDIVVNYSTVDGTAVAGEDFAEATNATITIPAGDTSATITVPVNGDMAGEADEAFAVKINSATAQAAGNPTLTITDDTGAGTIRNDDTTFRIVSATDPATSTLTVDEGAGTVSFKIVREGDTTRAGSVRFQTVNGVAGDGFGAANALTDFTARNEVVNFAANETEKTVTVTLTNDTRDEPNERFTVVLSDATGAVVAVGGDTGTVQITDDDAAPLITLTSPSAAIAEGNVGTTNAIFTVQLSAASDFEVRVSYFTEDGSATAGSDYNSTTGELIFAPGETSKTIAVQVRGDQVDEINDAETIRLNLTSPVNASFGGPAQLQGTATIADDDVAVLNVASAVREGDPTVRVTLSVASERTVTANYHTVNGSAVAGSDFTGIGAETPGTITFTPGETSRDLAIAIADDAVAEPAETFQVDLTNAVGATVGNETVTITDNDLAVVTINDVQVLEGTPTAQNPTPAKAVFTLTLSQPSSVPITVTYATQNGTATSTGDRADFQAITNGSVTFAPGETSKPIEVTINGDDLREADETFTVTLGSATSPATIGRGTGTGTILNDDTRYVLTIGDVRQAEGDTTGTVNVVVTLSGPALDPVSFRVATAPTPGVVPGEATAGVDYLAASQFFTLSAGQTTATLPITIRGDSAFELNEFFNVEITELSANASAPDPQAVVMLYNDDAAQINQRTIIWGDEDGDLVKLTVSKGSLSLGNDLIFKASGYGKVLQALELSDDGQEFRLANITIGATPQFSLGDPAGPAGNGRVDVGWIRASLAADDPLGNSSGVDLGIVRIDGDLGRIDAGDLFNDPGLLKLDVHSLGVRGAETMPTFSGQSAAVPTTTKVVGAISSVRIATDLAGTLSATGRQFGDIQNLFIGGTLLGTDAESPGIVSVTGTLGRATIGAIQGGALANSGSIIAEAATSGTIGSVTVLGAMKGGAGADSGSILGKSIGSVNIGSIEGGAGQRSGLVFPTDRLGSAKVGGSVIGGTGTFSGGIVANGGSLGSIVIGDDLRGGSGQQSGVVLAFEDVARVTVGGGVVGGAGISSGTISALGGNIGAVVLGREVTGASIIGGNGEGSGGVFADDGAIGSVTAAGDVRGGGSATVANSGKESGMIRAQGGIGKVAIGGALLGGEGASSGVVTVDAEVFGRANIGAVKIGQNAGGRSIVGGNGAGSGVVFVDGGNIGSVVTAGSVLGGGGDGSGGILAESALFFPATGTISKIEIGKNLVGGNGSTGELDTSGFIIGKRLSSVLIKGDLVSGESMTANLITSGAIRAVSSIGSLTVNGDILGNEDNPVFISAGGAGSTLAIARITVGGDVTETEILAGYGIDTTTDVRGQAVSADAQIGTVKLGRTAQSSVFNLSIAAGAAAGAGLGGDFGTDDDEPLGGTGVTDVATVFSRIAKVIIAGSASTLGAHGIVAQHLGSIRVGNQSVPLDLGPGNDLAPGKPISGDDEFRALELSTT